MRASPWRGAHSSSTARCLTREMCIRDRLCALAQKGDAAALDSLIDNNKSFIGKVANDLFRSMNLAQAGLNLDTDDLKQAGNLGLWKAVPKFDAARGMKFLLSLIHIFQDDPPLRPSPRLNHAVQHPDFSENAVKSS